MTFKSHVAYYGCPSFGVIAKATDRDAGTVRCKCGRLFLVAAFEIADVEKAMARREPVPDGVRSWYTPPSSSEGTSS